MAIVLFLMVIKMAASEVCVSVGMSTKSFYFKRGIFLNFFFLINEQKKSLRNLGQQKHGTPERQDAAE